MFFSGALLGLAGLLALTVARSAEARPARPWRLPRPPAPGPLFRWELREQARRRLWIGRAGYVGAMVVLLFGITCETFSLREALTGVEAARPERLAQVSARFLAVFLFAQLVAVILLTPAVVAAAVARDRDRGTWDLLLAAPLTGPELATAKLAAGLGTVLSVLAAGWPVLTLTMLFGGAEGGRVVGGLLLAAAGALATGAFALWRAVRGDGFASVLAWSYGFAGLQAAAGTLGAPAGLDAASPLTATVAMLSPAGDSSVPVIGGVFGQVVVAACAWRAAVRATRPEPRRELLLPPDPACDAPPAELDPLRDLPVPRLRDGDDPWLWKERHFRGGSAGWDDVRLGCGALLLALAAAGLGAWLMAGLAEWAGGWPARAALLPPARAGFVGLGLLAALQAGLRSAATLAHETQRRTLPCLFVLPWDRATLLRAKRRAALEAGGPAGLFALFCWLLAALSGAAPLPGAVAGLLLGASFAWCGVAGGLWLSARAPTAPAATVRWLSAWLLIGLFPLAIGPALDGIGPLVGVPAGGAVRGLGWLLPPLGAAQLLGSAGLADAGRGLAGALLYAAAAAWFDRSLRRRFAEEAEPLLPGAENSRLAVALIVKSG